MIAFVLVQKPTQFKAAGFLFCGDTHRKKTEEKNSSAPGLARRLAYSPGEQLSAQDRSIDGSVKKYH